jgi:uncharacterized protein (DUF169 family)
MTDRLKQIFRAKISPINVNGKLTGFINIPGRQMKFCEAVNYSFKVPIMLNTDNLGCPGARRCIGFQNNNGQLATKISDENNIPVKFISTALKKIPVLKGITHINLGLTECIENDTQPDLYIMYVEPFKITELMHKLSKMVLIPSVTPYTCLSVCGNVFANCYLNQKVTISFGCPESRESGGIGKDEIVVRLPFTVAENLLHYYDD